jgi:hypothetical protein
MYATMLALPRTPATIAGNKNMPLPMVLLITFIKIPHTPTSLFKPSADAVSFNGDSPVIFMYKNIFYCV